MHGGRTTVHLFINTFEAITNNKLNEIKHNNTRDRPLFLILQVIQIISYSCVSKC